MILEPKSVLAQVAVPPPGFSFCGGFWVTHDYNGFAVCDSVTPRLARCKKPGTAGARRLARTKPVDGELLILSASLPTQVVGPLLPPWCRWVALGGRRLHAKFGVLGFTDGQRRCWSAFVTSANLTLSGLLRNVEVLVTEETSEREGKSLAHELVTALHALVGSTAQREELTARVERLGLPVGAPLRRVHHTLDAPRSMLAQAFEGLRSRRCVIVSPPYGNNEASAPARELNKFLARNATVDVVTGKAAGKAPRFSAQVLDEFRKYGREVSVWGIREDAAEGRRPLHAKVLALAAEDGRMRVLAGSANFTTSGLLGKNRELGVLLDVDGDEFWSWDAQLGAQLWSKKVADADDSAVPEAQLVEVGVTARFHCRAGQTGAQSTFDGELELAWAGEVPTGACYSDRVLEVVPRQPLSLREDLAALQVTLRDGREETIPIAFEAPASDPGFWTRTKPKVPDADEEDFLVWLRWRKQEASAGVAKGAQTAGGSAGDRFTLLLKQPLVRLARHRAHLADLNVPELDRIVAELKEMKVDEPQMQVARTLLAPRNQSGSPAPSSELLEALSGWLESES